MIKTNNKTPTLIIDLIKLYFSKHPTIDFAKIKQKAKEINKTLKKYPNLSVPSWLEGRAKDISVNTFNFIKNNKHLLSPSKNLFIYQEYQQLLQFKLALDNLSILFKEDKKVQRVVTQSNVEKKWNSLLFLFLFWTIVITIILINSELYTFFAIYIFFSVSFVVYLLTSNEKYQQWFFSIKDNREEELENQINISNRKIGRNMYDSF